MDHAPNDEVKGQEHLTSTRAANADRAFRAAVIGLILWPVQLYALWLVLKILFAEERLDAAGRRRTFLAAVIAISFTIGGTLAACAYFGIPRQQPADINPMELNRPLVMAGTWEATVNLPKGDLHVVLELEAAGRIRYQDEGLEFAGAWGYDQHGIIYRMEKITRGDSKRIGRVFIMPLLRLKFDVMVLKLDDTIEAHLARRK